MPASPHLTFVLIHGAWHGGWCWKRVLPLLRAAGHEVFAPTLTGLGERAHLAGRDVNLDTHIADVVSLLEAEELEDVVLVGHSYAGMVITGAADRAPQRIGRLVYFDAFVPTNGKALTDFVDAARAARQHEEGERTGTIGPMPTTMLGVTDPADVAWVERRQVRQPYGTMSQPLRLANEARVAQIPRSFVNCHSATHTFDGFAATVRGDPSWRYLELPVGHDAMIIDPAGTVRVLIEAVT